MVRDQFVFYHHLLRKAHVMHHFHSQDTKSLEETKAIEKANASMLYGHGYDTENVDSETTVIDSLGQRITLHRDNVIGGGGQRFITLFCPYWVSPKFVP